jgi:serine/threonine protein kinase
VAGAFETTDARVTASFAYAAPEVLDGQPATTASDVYSLGATIHHLLAGRAAFVADDPDDALAALFVRIARDPVPDLRPLGVPGDVCAAVEAAMAKRADQRPASAGELGDRLRAAQAGRGLTRTAMVSTAGPTAAAGDTAVGDAPTPDLTVDAARDRRPHRRNRALVATAAIAVVALGAVGVWALARSGSSRPADIVNATPATGPLAVGTEPASVTAHIPSGATAEVDIAASAGQRVMIRVHFASVPSRSVDLVLQRQSGVLGSARTDGTDGVLGPVAIDATSSFAVRTGPVPGPLDATITVSNAAADVVETTTIAGPAVDVALTAPRQQAHVSFAGQAGQQLRLVWYASGPPVGDVDLVLFGPDGRQVATMSTDRSTSSDLLTLSTAGNYEVRISMSGDLTGKGALFLSP